MNALSGIEGGLTVGILVIDATVADVRLRSSRPTNIGAMLTGRPMGEALSLVPMLFSLCGIAQGIAAANACEAAIGITASPAQQAARDLLILNRVQFETRSASLPKPPDGRRSEAEFTGFELNAV